MNLVRIPDTRLWLEETNHNSQSSWELDEFILPKHPHRQRRVEEVKMSLQAAWRGLAGLWFCDGRGMSSPPKKSPSRPRIPWSTIGQLSHVKQICPLVLRTKIVGSQVSHFPAMGYILTRESSNAIAAWVSYHASGFAQYIQSFPGQGVWEGGKVGGFLRGNLD